jgi:predicted RNase H-like nuclease (RuvC/YqgF family)
MLAATLGCAAAFSVHAPTNALRTRCLRTTEIALSDALRTVLATIEPPPTIVPDTQSLAAVEPDAGLASALAEAQQELETLMSEKDDLARRVTQIRAEKRELSSTLLQSSKRHYDRFKSTVAELEGELKAKETELSTARFELDRTQEMLAMTQASYERFRGKNTLAWLVHGVGHDVGWLSQKVRSQYGRVASKVGSLRRRLWLSSVGSGSGATSSGVARSVTTGARASGSLSSSR